MDVTGEIWGVIDLPGNRFVGVGSPPQGGVTLAFARPIRNGDHFVAKTWYEDGFLNTEIHISSEAAAALFYIMNERVLEFLQDEVKLAG